MTTTQAFFVFCAVTLVTGCTPDFQCAEGELLLSDGTCHGGDSPSLTETGLTETGTTETDSGTTDPTTSHPYSAFMVERALNTGNWAGGTMGTVNSGRYGWKIGDDLYRQDNRGLPNSVETLAEILGANGFQTSWWSGNPIAGQGSNFDQGFAHKVEGDCDSEGGGYFLPDLTDGANQQTEAYRATGTGWFIHLHPNDLHDPHGRLHPSCSSQVKDLRMLVGTDEGCPVDGSANTDQLLGKDYSDEQFAACAELVRAAYSCEALQLDAELETFLVYLEDSGVFSNTAVVITSDHGEGLGETAPNGDYMFNHHGDLIPGVSDGELIVFAPSGQNRTQNVILITIDTWRRSDVSMPALEMRLQGIETIPGIASQVDIAPTVLGLLGVEAPQMDGVNVFEGIPTDRITLQYAQDPARSDYGAANENGHLTLSDGYWTLTDWDRQVVSYGTSTGGLPTELVSAINELEATTASFDR